MCPPLGYDKPVKGLNPLIAQFLNVYRLIKINFQQFQQFMIQEGEEKNLSMDKNKPAAQAAGTDLSRCNSTPR